MVAPPEPLGYKQTPQELKDYFVFQPGSYWQYEDSATGKLRTVTVTGVERDSIHVNYLNGQSQWVDDYHLYCYDAYDHSDMTYWIPAATSIYGPDVPITWGVTMSRSSSFWASWSSVFSMPILFGSAYDHNSDTIWYSNDYLTATFGGISYDSVVRIHHKNMFARAYSTSASGERCIEYYRRHLGLIRLEMIDSNQVWNLVDYNLIP